MTILELEIQDIKTLINIVKYELTDDTNLLLLINSTVDSVNVYARQILKDGTETYFIQHSNTRKFLVQTLQEQVRIRIRIQTMQERTVEYNF